MNNKYTVDMQETIDRVTAELSAALGREAALKETLERWLDLDKSRDADKEAYAQNAIDLRKRVDGLQQRLTAADERVDVLEGLLRNIWHIVPNGYKSEIDVALKPAESPRNQCDGCRAGIPVVNGAHRMGKPGGYPDTMSCTAKLYKP